MRQAIRRDTYGVIGVQPDATDLEIKRAFRERVKKVHPDVNGGVQAEEEFLRLVAAYRQTEVGRVPELPKAEPPTALPKSFLQKIIARKWTFLFVGAMATALYIRAQPPTEEPAAPEPEPFAAARVQRLQNVEPVWATTSAGESQLLGLFGRKLAVVTIPTEPQLPAALRKVVDENQEVAKSQARTGRDKPSAEQAGAMRPTMTAFSLKRAWEQTELSFSVDVMPPRRPKHIGEHKKRHLPAPSETVASPTGDVTPPQAPDSAAQTEKTILDQLTGLFGLK